MSTSDLDPKTLADLADATADLLERDGWCQGEFGGPGGTRCALAALMCASRSHVSPSAYPWAGALYRKEVMNALVGHLGLTFHVQKMHPIAEWNDDESRTVDEVVGAFRDVAIKHRPDASGG